MDFTKPKGSHWGRHHDDDWIDEVQLVGPALQIRAVTRERYKTSGMSGDEWRFSTLWQHRTPSAEWEDYDGGYRDLQAACARLYPGLYTSHPDWHSAEITHVDFLRKGSIVYRSTYEGEPRPLLVIAGHMPWALIQARENCSPDQNEALCQQPGCVAEACSVYRLKKEYCRQGHPSDPFWPTLLRFCVKHLRRGDCGLEDADANYEVLHGPGPDEARGWEQSVSKSIQLPPVEITLPGKEPS